MLPQKTLTQNTLYYTTALIYQKALAFVYFTFLARGLGVEDLGRYSFAFSFTTIFSVFVDIGLSSVLTREVAKDKSRVKEILANVLGVKIILSFLAYLLIVGLINLMNYPGLTKQLVYLTGLIMLLDTFSTTFWAGLRANQNLKYESLAIILFESLVVAVGMFFLILKLGVIAQVIAALVASNFFFIYSYTQLRQRLNLIPSLHLDKTLLKSLIAIAIPFALTGILARLNTQVDTIFLSKIGCQGLSCETNVGIYAIASKITLAIHFIPLAFVAALFPTLSEYYATNQEKLTQTFEKAMRYLMIISFPIALGILTLAPDFVPKIFGVQYKAAVLPLQILMSSLVFLFLTFPLGSLLNATSRQVQNTKQIGAAVLVNIILNIYLIPKFTYLGAALSSLASTLVMFGLGIWASAKVVDFNKKYLLKSFSQCLFAGIIMALVLRLLLFKVHFVFLIPLGAIIYFLALLLGGGFKKSDIEEAVISLKLKR